MSAWPGKIVIGLTGNIATGKSVVRRMLEHLGAYGIDADALGHRAIARGAPGYQPVITAFGKWVLSDDGQIDRTKLARVVFADPEALKRLEHIVHPLVRQAVDILVKRSNQTVVVIEAIKLLEGGLSKLCDSVWVTYAPQDMQMARLMGKRGMSVATAQQRILAQPVQELKMGLADVVIRNDQSFDETWKQVVSAWRKMFPSPKDIFTKSKIESDEVIIVQRAGPGQAMEIASFINKVSKGSKKYCRNDIMAAFGEKAYLILKLNSSILGVAGWQVENLVARVDEIFLDTKIELNRSIPRIIEEVERASQELQSEVSILFLPPNLAVQESLWQSLGYRICSIQSLGVRAWQEAAIESMPPGSMMYYKKLRDDLVLRPV